jgi:hypothetical protein
MTSSNLEISKLLGTKSAREKRRTKLKGEEKMKKYRVTYRGWSTSRDESLHPSVCSMHRILARALAECDRYERKMKRKYPNALSYHRVEVNVDGEWVAYEL